MSRRWVLFLCCLVVSILIFTPRARARGDVTINEAETRILFGPADAQVSLALVNPSSPAPKTIRLELLTPEGQIVATAERTETVATGLRNLLFNLPFQVSKVMGKDRSSLLWFRLRCRIDYSSNEANSSNATTLTLGRIAPEFFELEASASPMLHDRMPYQTWVRAYQPLTDAPSAGVRLEGTLEYVDKTTGKKNELRATGVTDGNGYSLLRFDLPASRALDDLELTILGTRGQLAAEANKSLLYFAQPGVFISTDKPLYQPGQTLHVRALVFGASLHALADEQVTLTIRDPEGTLLSRSDLKTSRFGIATADWAIPENGRLGEYRLELQIDDETVSERRIKVSRYDLPNFALRIKPNRPYYLPGQGARVEVRADYLFGQPVTRGHVRVVRETEREWNYAEQKYDIKEGQTYEGNTGLNGAFTTWIDLSDDWEELDNSDYRRFQDLSYAVYFTDPTTNRTEQRRFMLRITKEPIHVYLINPEGSWHTSLRQPLAFYVSTFYADGTPARCSVKINERSEHDGKAPGDKLLATYSTNRYGVAKIEQLRLPGERSDDTDLTLALIARDQHGQKGTRREEINLNDEPVIQVKTNKTLFAAGEPIQVTVRSSESELGAVLQVVRDWSIVHSEMIQLHDGRASVTLPYIREYTDKLDIAVFAGRADDGPIFGEHAILYPRNRNLRLDVNSNQISYRPGDDAQVQFRVHDREGLLTESALGVVVVDQAVNERARTDEEFGSSGAGFSNQLNSLLGLDESVAGFTRRDLDRIDVSRPVSPDLDLVAEVFLNSSSSYFVENYDSGNYEKSLTKVFAASIKSQLAPVSEALAARYDRTLEHPTDPASLRKILTDANIDLDSFRDPWGNPYRPVFSIDGQKLLLQLVCAGADKRFETGDDFTVESSFWFYFRSTGEKLDRVIRSYHARTGDFIRDTTALAKELRTTDLAVLRDPWSRPYRYDFKVSENLLVLNVTSGGPNQRFDGKPYSDDFVVWQSSIDYFAEKRSQLGEALREWSTRHSGFPENDTVARTALQGKGPDLDRLRDAWGNPYRLFFTNRQVYADATQIKLRGAFGGVREHTDIKPVTREIGVIKLHSPGPDGRLNTADDFDIAAFTGVISEHATSALLPVSTIPPTVFAEDNGAIAGLIKDANDAVIQGVQVEATSGELRFETTSNSKGGFVLNNLPPGLYEVRFKTAGFKETVVQQVIVLANHSVELNVVMEPGVTAETVSVTAGAAQIDTRQITDLPINGRELALLTFKKGVVNTARQSSETPRLREYFPETLVWQPLLETDKQGRAQLNFKLADNITTWQMSVIGSTEDGQVGFVEKEIKAFQPFFLEHDPPRVLTQGDEIALPVVVRNYLAQAQTVNLEIKPETWFTLLGPASKSTKVGAGDVARETFGLRATASVNEAKQRITARATSASDAIEKPVTVHPDGEEHSVTAGDIVTNDTSLTLDLPSDLIPDSSHGAVKIYPNLMAHLAESVEAIMQRPYGCGEQTISSTYPSLLLLRNFKQTDQNGALRSRADRYLRQGYNRLLNYRAAGGGFTYWGRGDADIALTAYALRFLSDARGLIPIDESVIEETRKWLINKQSADGEWPAFDYGKNTKNKRRSALLTAHVVQALAASVEPGSTDSTANARSVSRALDNLADRISEIDEPYAIAAFAMAANQQKDAARAAKALVRLVSLAHAEGNTTYWALETNTPFYGWGLAGRIETTALVVQALANACNSGDACQPALINRGLLFLLKEKDRYGVWYSSQATIKVLDALLAVFTQLENGNRAACVPSAAAIIINGQSARSVELPAQDRLTGPLTVDISSYLRPGTNRVEIRMTGASTPASVQAVANYYVPWASSKATADESKRAGQSSGLRLLARFDHTEGKISDKFSCHVEAERVGSSGYGMLLAEIGLPPGADVDRSSLDNAMQSSGWAINSYDILPDRVVFYLWPQAGGVKFDFKFRPRFGLKAKTAASSIYDYYNPEARAVVVPTEFTVH